MTNFQSLEIVGRGSETESNVYRRQIMTSKVDPRAVSVK